jgi:hypothetical protein
VVTASALEANPDKLCGSIDPPSDPSVVASSCTKWDFEIQTDERMLRTATDPQVVSLARQDCLDRHIESDKRDRAVRKKLASTQRLKYLLIIPREERLPEERTRIKAEIEACRAEATRRREERLAKLPELSEYDLSVIPEEQRLPEEQAALAEKIAARIALKETRRRESKWMRPALSAKLCIATDQRRGLKGEIKAEYKYGRIGGVVDKSRLYDLQTEIREQDQIIATVKASLRALKARPAACRDPLVVKVYDCLVQIARTGTSPDECSEDDVWPYVDLAYE